MQLMARCGDGFNISDNRDSSMHAHYQPMELEQICAVEVVAQLC